MNEASKSSEMEEERVQRNLREAKRQAEWIIHNSNLVIYTLSSFDDMV